jgi:hypothetical protein
MSRSAGAAFGTRCPRSNASFSGQSHVLLHILASKDIVNRVSCICTMTGHHAPRHVMAIKERSDIDGQVNFTLRRHRTSYVNPDAQKRNCTSPTGSRSCPRECWSLTCLMSSSNHRQRFPTGDLHSLLHSSSIMNSLSGVLMAAF